jgi:hypothetical protein
VYPVESCVELHRERDREAVELYHGRERVEGV